MKNFYLVSILIMLVLTGCANNNINNTANPTSITQTLPLIKPPVKTVTPKGLGGGSLQALKFQLIPSNLGLDIKNRFFSGGPTDIFGILQVVDGFISGVDQLNGPCRTQTPVAYSITPFGQSITFYGQCYRQQAGSSAGDPGLFQLGTKDGTTYIYSAQGAERVAAYRR